MITFTRDELKLPRLRYWREAAGLTQRQLAERAGISKTALGNIEAQKAEPRPATIQRLAEVLEVKTVDLMGPPDQERRP